MATYLTVQGDYGFGWEDVESIRADSEGAESKAEELRAWLEESESAPHRVVRQRKKQ